MTTMTMIMMMITTTTMKMMMLMVVVMLLLLVMDKFSKKDYDDYVNDRTYNSLSMSSCLVNISTAKK
jgi:hypothetical protein